MNIEYFGKILIGIGLAITSLVGVTVLLFAQDVGARFARVRAPAMAPSDASNMSLSCLVGNIGQNLPIVGPCPIGGYSAAFIYVGLFIALIGGALFFAARKPNG